MLLNCDLGENAGSGHEGADAAVMPYIDQASIACGFHAGDPLTMRRTLVLAAQHGVAVGAHPAYPDREYFGRRSMQLDPEEIGANLHYQVAALEGMARSAGLSLTYVKPHGALYHDMMARAEVRGAVFQAMAYYHQPLKLMMQSTAHADTLEAEADASGVELLFEAFADRRYSDDGSLLPRDRVGAVLDRESMLVQVEQLLTDTTVTSIGGRRLALRVDTICVHGDNPEAVNAVAAIRALVDG
jgi:UPF0271 protein